MRFCEAGASADRCIVVEQHLAVVFGFQARRRRAELNLAYLCGTNDGTVKSRQVIIEAWLLPFRNVARASDGDTF